MVFFPHGIHVGEGIQYCFCEPFVFSFALLEFLRFEDIATFPHCIRRLGGGGRSSLKFATALNFKLLVYLTRAQNESA